MIEFFKISQGKSIIGLQDLFTLDNKGTRGHTLKLSKMSALGTVGSIFFLIVWLIGGICWTSR